MRTPVAAIEGYVSLAINEQTATIDERARGYLSKAHESAQHLGRLFQDLLDVSKAEDGRLKNEPQLFNAVDFIRESVLMMTPKATEHNLGISYIPDTPATTEGGPTIVPTAYVNVDPDHLREIMTNLIDNAIKYTKQGDVVVNVTSEGDLVKISIKDSGIGISKADQKRIFEKFYRSEDYRTRESSGTGLGLYVVQKLSHKLSTTIEVSSQLNHGSEFSFTLPRK
jgi:signal transduction histidine kinase